MATKRIDIHTHLPRKTSPGVLSIVSHDLATEPVHTLGCISAGIHPWSSTSYAPAMLDALEGLLGSGALAAVGECGLDGLRGADYNRQREIFELQCDLAEAYHKPVIIHCVREWHSLMALHQRRQPRVPWIVHGFNKNAEVAQALLQKGMVLSFGIDLRRDEMSKVLREVPRDMFLLETDGRADISEVYELASTALMCSKMELLTTIWNNVRQWTRLSQFFTIDLLRKKSSKTFAHG